jgi:NADH-quinone oxidoreductase subunit H
MKSLSLIVPVLIAVAYLTLAERKIMGRMQRRVGPNLVGIAGLLQPLADGLKLFLKEIPQPDHSSFSLFFLAPLFTFVLSLFSWVVIPFDKGVTLADLPLGAFFLLAISSLSVYGLIGSGWASNSRYAFLGGLRSSAQFISYEVSTGLLLLCLLVCVGSFSLTEIVLAQESIWFILPFFPLFYLIFISSLAETNRTPFDLPEAEGELVAGYNVEYGSIPFAFFFLGEYTHILLLSLLIALLFLGGWLGPFFPGPFWLGIKTSFILFLFLWVRVAYPRYRYDQLMGLGWKHFLPLSFAFFLFISSTMKAFDWLVRIDGRVVDGISLEN